MADVCVLTVEGLSALSLKPNRMYRIGNRTGVEMYNVHYIKSEGVLQSLVQHKRHS